MPVSMQFKGIEFFLLVNLHFYDDLLKTSVDIVTVLVLILLLYWCLFLTYYSGG